MLADAEKYKEEDEKQRQRVAARNQLEGYVFSVKQAVDEAGNKLSEEDKRTVRSECDSALQWLDSNTLAEKDELEHKLQEVQQACSPFMTKIHKGTGDSSCGQQARSQVGGQGPTIEEVF
jgi:L1 cell adhesion molecule like protein